LWCAASSLSKPLVMRPARPHPRWAGDGSSHGRGEAGRSSVRGSPQRAASCAITGPLVCRLSFRLAACGMKGDCGVAEGPGASHRAGTWWGVQAHTSPATTVVCVRVRVRVIGRERGREGEREKADRGGIDFLCTKERWPGRCCVRSRARIRVARWAAPGPLAPDPRLRVAERHECAGDNAALARL